MQSPFLTLFTSMVMVLAVVQAADSSLRDLNTEDTDLSVDVGVSSAPVMTVGGLAIAAAALML